MADLIDAIGALFARHGHRFYDGDRAEPVDALGHALQCARLAEEAQAGAPLVAAALLHDIGHFLDAPDAADDLHEQRGAEWLAAAFGPEVVEPIRLHVEAKRYLVAVDAGYAAGLSPASVHSLALQGGPMSAAERLRFEARPFAAEALQLRCWDDRAKESGCRTATLQHYIATAVAPAQSTRRPSR